MKLAALVNSAIVDMQPEASLNTVSSYQSTLRCVLGYCGNLSVNVIFSRKWLFTFLGFLKGRELCTSTIIFYMGTLRAIYNYGVEQGKVRPVDNLFRGVLPTEEETIKRALDIDLIQTLVEADFSDILYLEFARDMFILSILLQGIPFIDLAHLRKEDLMGYKTISYKRHKTKRNVVVALTELVQSIIKKYSAQCADSVYLLPILQEVADNDPTEKNRIYCNALHNYNRHLKKIAARLGINVKLSSHVARHTWATLAHHLGTEIQIISQALGHSKEDITRRYLKLLPSKAFLDTNKTVEKTVFTQKLKAKFLKGLKKTASEVPEKADVHL